MDDPSQKLTSSWGELLEDFRALGGAVQNLRLEEEASGTGLFAVDPREPILLRVPRNLLLRVDDFEVTDGRLRIRQSAGVSEAERRFFDRYEDTLSKKKRAGSTAFLTALGALPMEIRVLLGTEFDLDYLFEGDITERVQNHFLQNRVLPWHGRPAVAPLLELANCGREGLRLEQGTHLQIQGYARSEIVLRHSAEDAFATFCRSGNPEHQPAAFSLSTRLEFEQKVIVIARDVIAGVRRGKDRIPQSSLDGPVLTLSYVLLGQVNSPRLARGTFCTLLRESGIRNPDEAFDLVVRLNTLKFVKLLQALEAHEGEMVSKLRTMARYQLEAMTHSIGTRELRPA